MGVSGSLNGFFAIHSITRGCNCRPVHCLVVSSRCEDPVGCDISVVRRYGTSLRELCAYHSSLSFTLRGTRSTLPSGTRRVGGDLLSRGRHFVRTVSSSLGATSKLSTMFRLIESVGSGMVPASSGRLLVFTGRLFSRLANMLNLICRRGSGSLSNGIRRLVTTEATTEGTGSFTGTSDVHSRVTTVNVILRSAPGNMG